MARPPEWLILVGSLADANNRQAHADALACHLGAEELLLFVEDREVGCMLPGPGFPQTLVDGQRWQDFLARCRAVPVCRGELRSPRSGEVVPAVAVASPDGTVAVLLGGRPPGTAHARLRHLLPLLGAMIRGERASHTADGHAAAAREAAAQAALLAESLVAKRHELQLALREAEHELGQRRRAEADLGEAHRRKDEFLAMLAHELRNPLAPLRNAAALLRRMATELPAARDVIDIIDRQTSHLARLVDDLVDVARISRGKVALHRQVLELGPLLQLVANGIRPLAARGGLRFRVLLPPSPLWIDGDEVRITQMLVNLLTNAVRYTRQGGEVTLSARREGAEALIVVSDTGVGIAPELLPNLFEIFVQGQRGLDRGEGGLGIGLWLVRQLAGLHGGRVVAESPGVGQGSTFSLWLPVCAPGPPADDRPPPVESGEHRRVLLVEDNVDSASTLAALLSAHGHMVRVAGTADQALAHLADFDPQVAVLDIGLPGMDGYALARRLRAHPALVNTRLIALTGYGQDADRERAERSGFQHFLRKPADPAELLRLVSGPGAGGR